MVLTDWGAYSKFLVGADGGKSIVRRQLQIPFHGDDPEEDNQWIRIDGRVKSNIPNPRAYG